jgi:hypothetical protein
MTKTDVRGAEIADYLASVRAALADLDPAVRDGLLEDLPEHVAEVAAADPEPLRTRLGSPAVFASDLRAAAGLPAGPVTQPGRTNEPSVSAIDRIRSLMANADREVGRLLGYDRWKTFLADLRPAWWVLRGAAAAAAIMLFLGTYHVHLVVLIAMAIGGVASVRFGRAARAAAPGGLRGLSVVVDVLCMLAVLWVPLLIFRRLSY